MKNVVIFPVVAGFVALLGCIQNVPPPAAADPPADAPVGVIAAGDDGQWGTIKGRIVWGGESLPKPVALNTGQEPRCKSKDGGPITSDEWVINSKNKGVRYVCVWLRANQGKLPVHPNLATIPDKDKEVVIDQPCCMFEPHGIAVREGQVIVAKNSAAFAHNVDWTGLRPTQGANQLVPPGGKYEIKMKPSEYPVNIKCGIHPWMKGWVRVFDHPYFAVTDEDGKFEIKNAPAGDWRIVIWHETGWRNQETGKQGDPIKVKANDVTDLGELKIEPRKG
jgi:plastocyanin